MREVDEALSKFYGRPVTGGYTNGGWPVVRPVGEPDGVVAGGFAGSVAPAVEALLRAQAALAKVVAEFEHNE